MAEPAVLLERILTHAGDTPAWEFPLLHPDGSAVDPREIGSIIVTLTDHRSQIVNDRNAQECASGDVVQLHGFTMATPGALLWQLEVADISLLNDADASGMHTVRILVVMADEVQRRTIIGKIYLRR